MIRRISFLLVAAAAATLAACTTIYDDIYFRSSVRSAAPFESIPFPPPGSTGDEWRAHNERYFRLRMALLFEKHLSERFPKGATAAKLQSYLERDGFRCAPSSNSSDGQIDCIMKRVSHDRHSFLKSMGPAEFIWLVRFADQGLAATDFRATVTRPAEAGTSK